MALAPSSIDAAFLALPLRTLADVALQTARDAGAEHADFRLERIRAANFSLRDGRLEGSQDATDTGFAVRVLLNGSWGFAAGVELGADSVRTVATQAIAMARLGATMTARRVELAAEPVYSDVTWVSAYEVDPFDLPESQRVGLLADYSDIMIGRPGVSHVTAGLDHVRECKFYADTAGTVTTQQRVRVHPQLEALAVDSSDGRFETMRTLGAPAGRGWEYVTGADGVHDWRAELAEIPDLLAAKLAAPTVEAGVYDLVIDPTNLFLTIHESVGHATELDRALGYEANYAGTSFATLDKLGSLTYGSPAMTVTGDRNVEHGLSSIGYDDEGVAAQQWDIVRDGRLVGYQLDRAMAAQNAEALGSARSNGCAFADSPGHVPVQRMANVSLLPAAGGPNTDELIAGVDNGLYIVGDKSWSIDMQRYNFQFTGQRFFTIRNGKLGHQVRDVAYQSNTLQFWGSLEAVGGEQTHYLGGAFNCGKAQPGQVAPVSHGAPSTLFRGINVLNTVNEGKSGDSE